MDFGEPIGLLAVLVGIAGGCSSMAPDDDTYNTVHDLQAAGGGMGGSSNAGGGPNDPVVGEWGCLEAPQQPVGRDPFRVQYRVPILDFDSQPVSPRVVPMLQVTVCDNADCNPALPICQAGRTPAPTEQCVTITNALPGAPEYVYQIDLPYQFSNGYLKLEAPNYAEMDYIFGGPMIGAPEGGSLVIGLVIPMLTTAARASAYRDVGVSEGGADVARGTLGVRTLDCERATSRLSPIVPEGHRAPFVRVEAQPDEPPAPAVAWSVSDNNAFSRDDLLTDQRGVAGYLNTPIGTLVVVAQSPSGESYPDNAPTYRVRPGVITLAELRDGLNVWGQ